MQPFFAHRSLPTIDFIYAVTLEIVAYVETVKCIETVLINCILYEEWLSDAEGHSDALN